MDLTGAGAQHPEEHRNEKVWVLLSSVVVIYPTVDNNTFIIMFTMYHLTIAPFC